VNKSKIKELKENGFIDYSDLSSFGELVSLTEFFDFTCDGDKRRVLLEDIFKDSLIIESDESISDAQEIILRDYFVNVVGLKDCIIWIGKVR